MKRKPLSQISALLIAKSSRLKAVFYIALMILALGVFAPFAAKADEPVTNSNTPASSLPDANASLLVPNAATDPAAASTSTATPPADSATPASGLGSDQGTNSNSQSQTNGNNQTSPNQTSDSYDNQGQNPDNNAASQNSYNSNNNSNEVPSDNYSPNTAPSAIDPNPPSTNLKVTDIQIYQNSHNAEPSKTSKSPAQANRQNNSGSNNSSAPQKTNANGELAVNFTLPKSLPQITPPAVRSAITNFSVPLLSAWVTGEGTPYAYLSDAFAPRTTKMLYVLASILVLSGMLLYGRSLSRRRLRTLPQSSRQTNNLSYVKN